MSAPDPVHGETEEAPLVDLHPQPLVRRRTASRVPGARWLAGLAAALAGGLALGWFYLRTPIGAPTVSGRAAGPATFRLPPLLMPAAAATAQQPVTAPAPQGAPPAAVAAGPVDLQAPAAGPRPSAGAVSVEDASPVLWRESTSGAVTAGPSAAAGAGLATASPLVPTLSAAGFAPLRAVALPPLSRILAKGTSVGCTLETGIESQLAGLVSCLIGVPVYGADGRIALLPRGTRLLGEARSEARSGQSRVFVLWVEARTPDGVLVPLASPATDALGRAGVPGAVDTHFFERFGAAILISVLDASVQAAVGRAGGTVVVAPQSSEAVLTEVLRATIAIPPTITVAPGTHLTVLVARDVDFGASPASPEGR